MRLDSVERSCPTEAGAIEEGTEVTEAAEAAEATDGEEVDGWRFMGLVIMRIGAEAVVRETDVLSGAVESYCC